MADTSDPDPSAPPSPSAPGSVEERREEIVAKRKRAVAADPDGPSEHGTDEGPSGFKEVLESDPVKGTSKSTPD